MVKRSKKYKYCLIRQRKKLAIPKEVTKIKVAKILQNLSGNKKLKFLYNEDKLCLSLKCKNLC